MAQPIGRIYVRSFTFVTEKRCHKRVADSEVYIYVGGRAMPGAIAEDVLSARSRSGGFQNEGSALYSRIER